MNRRLDSAVRALRTEADGEELSSAARARIVETAWNENRNGAAAFEPTFKASRWLVWLGVAPAALIALFAVAVMVEGPASPSFVGAAKVGDEVVFNIADGSGPHRVVKSTDPRRFNPAAAVAVEDGRFADRINSGPVIVYYRID